MKFHKLLLTAFVCILALVGCAHDPHPQMNQDFLHETWMRTVNLNPMLWTRGADRWFFTGEPNATESAAHNAPGDKAISLTSVKVTQFSNIEINGCFQVQLTSAEGRNSITILGPNEKSRQILVEAQGDTVIISQPIDPKTGMANLKDVIVRINVQNLHQLKVKGAVNVEGRLLVSNGLSIYANDQGNVLLSGTINLQKVDNTGPGAVSVLNTYTPCLTVINRGNGIVNASGRVGIQTISNLTNGAVHIIGADTRSLQINACGNSRTSVAGYANLRKLNATGNACVHLYWINSDAASVYLNGNAHVGLAGCMGSLELLAIGNSRFGGQYLQVESVYAQTKNNAHANVTGRKRIFASAINTSSIYYFGASGNVSRYTQNEAIVIPVWSATSAPPVPAYAPQFVTTMNNLGVVHRY